MDRWRCYWKLWRCWPFFRCKRTDVNISYRRDCWCKYSILQDVFSCIKQVFYCQTQKTLNTRKTSGMLIVYWPIAIKFRTCEQTSKPQTNYRCCLRFSYLAPYWLISRNIIAFHKYFWCSQFCEFHSNSGTLWELQQVFEILTHFLLVFRVFIRHQRLENSLFTMKNSLANTR